jgi:hypothetical protein
MTKQPAGSVICDGQPLTVIDPAAIMPKRIEVTCDCGCRRKRVIDVTPAVKLAFEEAARGVLHLPDGAYRAIVNVGYSGQALSVQLVKD